MESKPHGPAAPRFRSPVAVPPRAFLPHARGQGLGHRDASALSLIPHPEKAERLWLTYGLPPGAGSQNERKMGGPGAGGPRKRRTNMAACRTPNVKRWPSTSGTSGRLPEAGLCPHGNRRGLFEVLALAQEEQL